jgi:hypothetical protein
VQEAFDHRWGSRFDSGMAAELRSEEGLQAEGLVINVSLSGAFIETSLQPAVFSRMYVRPSSASAHWMPAYIVRTDGNGVALEWVHPGMAAIRSWLPLRAWQQAEPTFDPLRELRVGTR